MGVDIQLHLIEWLSSVDERIVRFCRSFVSDGDLWDDHLPPKENDMRYRVAFLVTHGNAQRKGKKSKSTLFTQEDRWAFDDKAEANLLNLAFHALSAEQWKYFLSTVADGERSALLLASRWSAALIEVPSFVLVAEAL